MPWHTFWTRWQVPKEEAPCFCPWKTWSPSWMRCCQCVSIVDILGTATCDTYLWWYERKLESLPDPRIVNSKQRGLMSNSEIWLDICQLVNWQDTHDNWIMCTLEIYRSSNFPLWKWKRPWGFRKTEQYCHLAFSTGASLAFGLFRGDGGFIGL